MPLNQTQRILIVGLCGVGDLLFFLPALKALRAQSPEAIVDLLVLPSGSADLFKNRGLVDRVITFPFTRWHASRTQSQWRDLLCSVAELRRQQYKVSIWPFAVTTVKKQILDILLGAHRSIMHQGEGFFSSRRLWPRQSLLTFKRTDHVVERNADLVRVLGVEVTDLRIELPLTDEEIAWGKQHVHSLIGQRYGPLIGFHPSGNLRWSANRQWSPTAYAQVADRVARQLGAVPLLFGSSSETELLRGIAAKMATEPVIISNLSLPQVAAVIRHLDALVGNDSALVHLAAALGMTAVSVVGPTNPARTGPWGCRGYVVRLDLPCSPCFDDRLDLRCPHHLCLNALLPEHVFSVLKQILASPQETDSLKPTVHNVSPKGVTDETFQQFMIQRKRWERRQRVRIL